MHGSETPTGIHCQLFAFYGEDTVDITTTVCCWMMKSRDTNGSLDPNDQLHSGRPVVATHDLTKQEFDKLISENC
jgi:hypothetical protein